MTQDQITENQILIPEFYLEAISPVEQASLQYLKQVKELKIENQQTYHLAAKIKKEVTSFLSGADKKRLEITKPARDLVEAINDKAKEALKGAEEAKQLVTKYILDYEAILEAQKQAEKQRIAKINQVFLVADTKPTIEANLEMIEKIQTYFKQLPESDQAIPEIKQACHSLLERVNQKIAILKEQEAQKAEADRLAKLKTSQDAEALRLAEQQAELDRQAREQEVEQRRLKDEAIKHQLEKERLEKEKQLNFKPATGIRTYTKYEIEDASLVPREYCSPDSTLINSAIKAGVKEIPGVRIYQEKK